jgi:hypothetical protein
MRKIVVHLGEVPLCLIDGTPTIEDHLHYRGKRYRVIVSDGVNATAAVAPVRPDFDDLRKIGIMMPPRHTWTGRPLPKPAKKTSDAGETAQKG